jgi:MFS family permease
VLPAIAAGAISDQIAVAAVAGLLVLTAVALGPLDDRHGGHQPRAWHLLLALLGIGVLVSVGVTPVTVLILLAALVPACAAGVGHVLDPEGGSSRNPR